MNYGEEVSIRAEANASVSYNFNAIQMIASLVSEDNVAKFCNSIGGKLLKEAFSPLSATLTAGVGANVSAGFFSFYNTKDETWFWKTHILAIKLSGQIYGNAQVKAKANALSLASAEAGISFGAGIGFKLALGCRMDFRNPFWGCAYSWWAGAGLYYKLKAF